MCEPPCEECKGTCILYGFEGRVNRNLIRFSHFNDPFTIPSFSQSLAVEESGVKWKWEQNLSGVNVGGKLSFTSCRPD